MDISNLILYNDRLLRSRYIEHMILDAEVHINT